MLFCISGFIPTNREFSGNGKAYELFFDPSFDETVTDTTPTFLSKLLTRAIQKEYNTDSIVVGNFLSTKLKVSLSDGSKDLTSADVKLRASRDDAYKLKSLELSGSGNLFWISSPWIQSPSP